jgi:hypothetical protein
MQKLTSRLGRLEAAIFVKRSGQVRLFSVQGPVGLSCDDAIAFLREQGHYICDEDTNIVRIVIGAENGKPVDLPLADLTARQTR